MRRATAHRDTVVSVTVRSLFWFAGSLLAACSFDTSGVPLTGDAARIDANPPDAPGDAGTCLDDIRLVLSIGGISEELPTDVPYVHALPGDLVELSAAGSCGRAGGLVYEWQISPIDATRETAAPDLASETITIYPVFAEDYTVTLTVTSGAASASRSVLGVRSSSWQRHDSLASNPEIRDLATGGDTLWIAHARGAHRLPLGQDPGQDAFIDIAAELSGDALSQDLGAVHYRAADQTLWLAQDARRDDLWRIDVSGPQPVSSLFDYSAALGAGTGVLDIIDAEPGIALATDRGLVRTDGEVFSGVFIPPDGNQVHALAMAGELWAGSRQLYPVDSGGAPFDPFAGAAGADARVRALAFDATQNELWVATDGSGAARVQLAGGPQTLAVYNTAAGTLASDRLRDITLETTGPYAGDAWAATSQGVARYIRARDTWLLMGNSHGLQQRTNVQAVVIDAASGRRVIFAGTRAGLVSLRAQ